MEDIKNHCLLPDLEMGLVSISPVCGCTGGCQYCYLCLRKLNKVEMNSFGISDTIDWLQSQPDFSVGKTGNILCMGSWGEIFPRDRAVRKKAYEWIQQLLALRNPMAIVTKAHISTEEAKMLVGFQKYPHQLIIMETVTTITQAKQIEPRCCMPEQRFQSLYNCTQYGLDTALLINPYLKGITDVDLEALFLNCLNCGIKEVVVSPLYYNGDIIKKISQCEVLQNTGARLRNPTPTITHGLATETGHLIADEITEDSLVIEEQAKKYGILVFYHYLCVLSRQYHRMNTAFWGNPTICKNCGHCVGFRSDTTTE